jgi:hypothetical protein
MSSWPRVRSEPMSSSWMGTSIVYPALVARVALLGSVNAPAIMELKSAQDCPRSVKTRVADCP